MTEEQETYHIEKDPVSGRIVSLEQTSERAAEIGALGGRAAAKRRAKDAQELYNALVAVLPALDDVERQAARDMLLLHLCRTAVSDQYSGSGAAGRSSFCVKARTCHDRAGGFRRLPIV